MGNEALFSALLLNVSFVCGRITELWPVLVYICPSGVKNPVLVANRLLSEAQRGKLSAGRIPPW